MGRHVPIWFPGWENDEEIERDYTTNSGNLPWTKARCHKYHTFLGEKGLYFICFYLPMRSSDFMKFAKITFLSHLLPCNYNSIKYGVGPF